MKTNIESLQADSYYHIYNRGINGENIFKEERNYAFFLEKYSHFISPIADTYAYCLLRNHFHLMIRTRPESDIKEFVLNTTNEEKPISWILSNAFASFFKSYAQAINKSYKRTGALFEEPFRRILVDGNDYFTELVYYIHHNPTKHGFISDFRAYKHSSYQSILVNKQTKLKREEVLEWFGGRENYEKFHAKNDVLDNLDKFDIE